jgi:hypothetical protein
VLTSGGRGHCRRPQLPFGERSQLEYIGKIGADLDPKADMHVFAAVVAESQPLGEQTIELSAPLEHQCSGRNSRKFRIRGIKTGTVWAILPAAEWNESDAAQTDVLTGEKSSISEEKTLPRAWLDIAVGSGEHKASLTGDCYFFSTHIVALTSDPESEMSHAGHANPSGGIKPPAGRSAGRYRPTHSE